MNNQNTKLTYTAAGDYFIPNIELAEVQAAPIGKYGLMRQSYLQEHRPGLYNRLLLSEKLQAHLMEIDQTAHRRLEQVTPLLAKQVGATEELKAGDPLKWVGLMNTCKAQAEEVILAELIFA